MIVDGLQGGGVSAVWVLANLCYAGMRAQGPQADSGGLFLLSWLSGHTALVVCGEGRQRFAYGINLLHRDRSNGA